MRFPSHERQGGRSDASLALAQAAGSSRDSRVWPLLFISLAYLPRERTTKQLDAAAATRRITPPLVNAATVKRAAPSTELLLPGNITPITEAYIFARAAGYLKRRYVDIGDRVRAGQKLADIEAPDLDQQVSQARGCAGTSPGTAWPGPSHARAAHRNARSGGDHLAEIQDPDRRRRGVAAGRRQSIDRSQDSGGECRCAAKDRPRNGGVRSGEPGDVGPAIGASRLRANHRAV